MNTPAGTASIGLGANSSLRFWPLLRASFTRHAIFLALSMAYLADYLAVDRMVPAMAGMSGIDMAFGILASSIPMALFALVLFKFAEMAIYERPKHPAIALWRNVRAVLADREKMATGLPMFMALIIFIYVFSMVKANIPVLNAFSWDRALDRWDAALHFGYRPWELLQPVLGYWPVTFLINFNYNLWFVLMNVFWVYYAFLVRPGEERTRFFLSFMTIAALGGGLLAIVFSSAGPCYFGRLGLSPDPYAGLMSYLSSANEMAPIWALATQDILWKLQSAGSALGGISAMPSVHNATALLFILTSAARPVWVRRLLWAHAALIFLGSIHLGWHYAIDAYAAWALALAVWLACGPVARRWEKTSAARSAEV